MDIFRQKVCKGFLVFFLGLCCFVITVISLLLYFCRNCSVGWGSLKRLSGFRQKSLTPRALLSHVMEQQGHCWVTVPSTYRQFRLLRLFSKRTQWQQCGSLTLDKYILWSGHLRVNPQIGPQSFLVKPTSAFSNEQALGSWVNHLGKSLNLFWVMACSSEKLRFWAGQLQRPLLLQHYRDLWLGAAFPYALGC